jgi:hypothetical protein
MTASPDSALNRPAALWKGMPDAERRLAAEAFWDDTESIVEQAEVMALIARKLNFRFKSVQTMSTERKVKHLIALGNVSDGVAGRLLVSYHLTHQRPMMGAFLDALGIEHENGLIAQEAAPQPDADKLKAAATTIRAAYPATAVDLYFATLALQDPETWGGVKDL